MENIKNNRTGTDATFRVGLKDGAMIDWPSIEIKQVFMYSTEQRTFGGRTSFAIDAEDSKVLVVTWPASEQIYLGEHRLVVRIEADGVEATYDAVAINQVPFTQDVAEPVTPAPVEVNIVIDSVDTTVIREILAACQEATDRAIRASEGVEEAIARANASAERAEEAVGRAEHAIEVVDEQIARVEKIEENIAQALVDAEQAKQIAEQASATAEAASETAQTASTQATEAIADAHKAIEEAQTAKGISDTATANANAAAANANSKATLANTAATSANTAAGNANTKAGEANTAAINANNAAQTANTAATNANNKASDAQTAAGEARAAAARVDTAIATANTAAGNANAAATEARNTASTAAAEAKSIAETAATNANNAATEARNAAQTATESAGVLQGKLERGEVIPLLSTDLKHPTHQEESFASRVSQGGMVDVKSIKGNSVVIEGEVVNFTAESIKATGRNLWDEEWVAGGIEGGVYHPDWPCVCSKNYNRIPQGEVIPINCAVVFYDAKKEFITDTTSRMSVPSNAVYIRISTFWNYGTTYKYDAGAVMYDPSFNGQYEPYRKVEFDCDPSKAMDAEGNPLFPDGLCKAGEAYDEMGETRDCKRIGVVKLKDLTWLSENLPVYINSNSLMNLAKAPLTNLIKANINCIGFNIVPRNETDNVMDMALEANGRLTIRNAGKYPGIPTFLEAHGEDELYYELASPIVVDHEPRRMFYSTFKGGTESVEGENTTPIKADMGNGYDLCKIVDYLTSKAEK